MRSAIWDGGNYNNPSNVLITAEIPRISSDINVYVLTAGIARSISIPAGAEFAFFNSSNTAGSANATFFLCDASISTATIPSADILNGTGAEFMTTMRNVRNVAAISVIAPVNSLFYVSFYSRADNVATS